MKGDPINPPHYTDHPSGVECIQITEHMGFNLGNALKYIWRCDLKHDAVEDLKKAKWYLEREIELRGAGKKYSDIPQIARCPKCGHETILAKPAQKKFTCGKCNSIINII